MVWLRRLRLQRDLETSRGDDSWVRWITSERSSIIGLFLYHGPRSRDLKWLTDTGISRDNVISDIYNMMMIMHLHDGSAIPRWNHLHSYSRDMLAKILRMLHFVLPEPAVMAEKLRMLHEVER